MNQSERRRYLIGYLLSENPQYSRICIPTEAAEQRRLLRGLMNVRPPKEIGKDFLDVQDEYLKTEIERKGITDFKCLTPVGEGIYLRKGDITTLKCDAVVNAANSKMLGCFCPNHGCIDNAIHTFAGLRLRRRCAEIMCGQGHDEPTGGAKITPAYNLPCRYILHTVGPIVFGKLKKRDEMQLASCYRSCLETAGKHGVQSVAFCCISTGEFHFPNRRAAEIAIDTVKEYRERTNDKIEVIFNVFKEIDRKIYEELLG